MNATQELIQSAANDRVVIPAFTGALVAQSLGEIELLLDADTLYHKGLVARGARKYKEAIAWFERTISVDPEHMGAIFELGFCHIGTRDIRVFLREYFDGNLEAATERGIWYYHKYFSIRSKGSGPDENDSGAANNLGVLYGIRNNDAEEERNFRFAIHLNHRDVIATCNLARVRLDKNDLDEAEYLLNLAIDIDPEYADSYLHLGKLRIKKDNGKTAVENFLRFLELVDLNDVWEVESVMFARDYIENSSC